MDTTALRKMPLASVFFLLAGLISCMGQGTLRITFDGPPEQPPGTQYLVQDYAEGGLLFTPLTDPYEPGSGLVQNGGGDLGYPENGTAYLESDTDVTFRFVDGSLFGLVSVDLAGWSSSQPDFAISLIGYKSDGSTVTTTFSGSGIDFRTLYFDSGWMSGLARVEIPERLSDGWSIWSMDNLVIAVPEPASGALLACSAFAAMLLRKKRRTG